ncbi:MAG: hypothetical protein RH859_07395 [Longimicrobiales bacterium]
MHRSAPGNRHSTLRRLLAAGVRAVGRPACGAATGPLVAFFLALAPAAGEAQAVCSAPHSSPMVSASGSVLMLDPGAGWVQVAARGVRSTRFYGTGGSVHDLPGLTSATTVSAYLTGSVGLVPGLEIWGQLPVHRLDVRDEAVDRSRVGLGDPRVSVRVGPELLGFDPLPVSLRGGIKVAGSDFPVDSRVLPLSEGQTDYEVAVESGIRFGEGLYAVGWLGYRWRTEDASSRREPGDERFGHLAFGGDLGSLRLELGLDALDGLAPRQDGLALPASARRLVQISPTVGWAAGAGRFQASAQIPVSGRSLPTGPAVGVGYLLAWSGR